MPVVNGDSGFEFVQAPEEPVLPYLEGLGYTPATASTWHHPVAGEPRPALDVEVSKHLEVQGHTWYVMRCSLVQRCDDDSPSTPGAGPEAAEELPRRTWQPKRRLAHFRTLLYEPVKQHLGESSYSLHFKATPFAGRGGMPGTTRHLQEWLGTLANRINSSTFSPEVAALTLRFLEPPSQPTDSPDGDSEAVWNEYHEFARLEEKLAAATGTHTAWSADGDEPAASETSSARGGSKSEHRAKRWYWWMVPT